MAQSFPLFLATPAAPGKKGACVKLFTGMWLIDWDSKDTKLAISVNGEPFVPVDNLHKFYVEREATVQALIEKPGSERYITAFASRVH